MAEKTWGFRFNMINSYLRANKHEASRDHPDWLTPYQMHDWQEAGLVVWNSDEKKLTRLSGAEALKLSNDLASDDGWKIRGVSITRLAHHFSVEIPRRGRRKKQENDQESAKDNVETKEVLEELVHLPPEAGAELIQVLQANGAQITEMARQEKERFQEAIAHLLEAVEKFHREKEQSDLDMGARGYKWESWAKNRWKCIDGRLEGRVCLAKGLWFWDACVQGDGYHLESNSFKDFKAAVEWVEERLRNWAGQPLPEQEHSLRSMEQIEADRERLRRKLEKGPYWILPAALEPGQVTYQVFLELEAQPVEFKTYESMCGETHRYAERYLSLAKQAISVGLDFDAFEILQPLGENSDWYQFESLTAYFEKSAATEQAQKFWNQCHILHEFKAGKVVRARYGIKERETGFVALMGACEPPDRPWDSIPSRSEFMEERAFRESVCFALDVNDYRDFLGFTPKGMSDVRLLAGMHKARARSKHVPRDASLESKLWLAQHEADAEE